MVLFLRSKERCERKTELLDRTHIIYISLLPGGKNRK